MIDQNELRNREQTHEKVYVARHVIIVRTRRSFEDMARYSHVDKLTSTTELNTRKEIRRTVKAPVVERKGSFFSRVSVRR